MNGPFSKELLQAEVGDPDNDFLLVEDGEKIVGYARMRQAYRPKDLDAGKMLKSPGSMFQKKQLAGAWVKC